MLRRELLVEVEHDHIVVRVTGTSYAVSYYRMASSTGLVARNLPVRDDHRAPMTGSNLSKTLGSSLKPKRKSSPLDCLRVPNSKSTPQEWIGGGDE